MRRIIAIGSLVLALSGCGWNAQQWGQFSAGLNEGYYHSHRSVYVLQYRDPYCTAWDTGSGFVHIHCY